jgi:hypothetical protein
VFSPYGEQDVRIARPENGTSRIQSLSLNVFSMFKGYPASWHDRH